MNNVVLQNDLTVGVPTNFGEDCSFRPRQIYGWGL